jgi:hypothetical protein
VTADQELKIRWEWDAAAQARAPEHRATWARIEIKAGTDFVTLAEDRESGSSRRSIYCPLYPLAEWIAYNWWFLQAETRPSSFLSQDLGLVTRASQALPRSLRERHSITASGDGFAWPDLVIVPDGSETRLVWGRDSARSSNWPIRFLTYGDCWVESELVMHEFELLITETLTRLSEQGVTGTVLENEWAAIQETGQEEAEYCRAAARLGLDPYSAAEPYEQDIIKAAEILDGEILTDFLNAVNPDDIGRALAWISSGLSTIGRRPAGETALATKDTPEVSVVQELRAARSGAQSAQGAPWNIGYQQARIVRDHIEPDITARLAVDRFVASRTRLAPDSSLQALGASADNVRPLVIVGQRRTSNSNRFTLSRALWHSIWDDSSSFIVTTAHTHRQQVERSFAAELLAPAAGIAALLESPPEAASQEELDQVAQRFGVSSLVVEHQVRNHLIAA